MSANLLFRRILLTLSVSVLGVLVPYLEYGPTHVFNPDWPGHAKLHDVWQLATNSVFSAAAAYLAWTRPDLRMAARLGLVAPIAFLAAYLTMDLYGGSMVNSDGTELKFGSVNASLVMMLIVSGILGFLSFSPTPAERARQS
ncbi:hypothetical protein [Sphingopyxis sp. LK2115]|jgi:hypothetical protein|uniref:hypothetical protein n=1 Tax=Sphingopyxis sp. LK2115 TaxID=2744558 RepID=UPI001660A8A1|nr:hypothetical protein [Sphingopyxis sp. LK2115]